MPSFLHKPGHPLADALGTVEKYEYYEYEYYNREDKRAMIGNRIITFNYIGDEMPDTQHMADGKHYTSKTKFRQATKAAGCVEVGNEAKTIMAPRKVIEPSRRQRRDDIKKTIYELRNRKN